MEYKGKTINLRRVVVTGVGLLSPVGNNVPESWAKARAGVSGIGPITRFDTSEHSSKIAGEIKDFDPTTIFDRKELRKFDPYIQYAQVAAIEAIEDSGVDKCEDKERIGVYIGSGIGGISTIESNSYTLRDKGPRRVSPFFIPASIANLASGHVSIRYGLQGPNMANCTACATSTHAIGDSFRMIQRGDADAMVAGGAEYPITPLAVAGFAVMRALSTRNEDPVGASSPFDKNRDGFVIAEGAAVVVLEELEHAVKRGANIYAEVVGYGFTGDAFHITAPDEDAKGTSRSMVMAVNDAGAEMDEVDYINAHGTSTPFNDKLETKAIKKAFGDHAYKLDISSTKSMTGHMLGAAGGTEAIFTCLALKESFIPPTVNYNEPDEECDLNYTPNKGVEKDIKLAISNSFGFGGTNGTLALRKFEGK